MTGFNVQSFIQAQNAQRGFENQANGAAFEFRVMRLFKKRSDVLFVIRSAGSHSPIDIVVQMKSGKQLWITCKRNAYVEPRERLVLSKIMQFKPDNVEVRLYYYLTDKKMKWSRIEIQ